jgi:hypothetical protein
MPSTYVTSFFELLKSEDDLVGLIGKEKEGLYLEFKMKKDRSHGNLEDSDRRQFSRALSGFANSDGGILVWGMETDKNSYAHALKPIVDGVQLEVIAGSRAGEGYVKCLIPASDKTPHRAMLAEREYFRRTTEGFYRLEHFDLEDMFGRRPRPVLLIKARIEGTGSGEAAGRAVRYIQAVFTIENIGRGSAVAPYLELDRGVSSHGITGYSRDGAPMRMLQGGIGMKFLTDAGFVIHPETSFEFAATNIGYYDSDPVNAFHAVYRVAALNYRLTEGTIHIAAADLMKIIGRA